MDKVCIGSRLLSVLLGLGLLRQPINTGYLVDVYRTKENGTEVILGTIAVDVSSDWTRFPRYGFVATFECFEKGGWSDREGDGFPEPLPH